MQVAQLANANSEPNLLSAVINKYLTIDNWQILTCIITKQKISAERRIGAFSCNCNCAKCQCVPERINQFACLERCEQLVIVKCWLVTYCGVNNLPQFLRNVASCKMQSCALTALCTEGGEEVSKKVATVGNSFHLYVCVCASMRYVP